LVLARVLSVSPSPSEKTIEDLLKSIA